jgi:hypothetical protein
MNAITKLTGLIVLVTAGFFAVQAGTAFAAPPDPAGEDYFVPPCEVVDCTPPDDDGMAPFPVDPCVLIDCGPGDLGIELQPVDPCMFIDCTPDDGEAPADQPAPADDAPAAPADEPAAPDPTEPAPALQDAPAGERQPASQVNASGDTAGDAAPADALVDESSDEGGFWTSPLVVGGTGLGLVGILVLLLVMARRKAFR